MASSRWDHGLAALSNHGRRYSRLEPAARSGLDREPRGPGVPIPFIKPFPLRFKLHAWNLQSVTPSSVTRQQTLCFSHNHGDDCFCTQHASSSGPRLAAQTLRRGRCRRGRPLGSPGRLPSAAGRRVLSGLGGPASIGRPYALCALRRRSSRR